MITQTSQFTYNSDDGLTDEQVKLQRTEFGPNELTPPVTPFWWRELLDKFRDPTIIILLVAGGASLAVTAVERYALGVSQATFFDAIGIFFAIALATLVGFLSERRQAKAFTALNKIKEEFPVSVLRDRQWTTLAITELVPGDWVRLDAGDRIPADGILLDANGLYINEGMLTGESLPARKTAFVKQTEPLVLAEIGQKVRLADDFFVARGTLVADGHGFFLVTATGDRTLMGGIARNLADTEGTERQTPLVLKLSRLASVLSAVGGAGALAIFSVMVAGGIVHSELRGELTNGPFGGPFFGVGWGLLSLGIGFFLTQKVLRPFFSQLGVPLDTKRKQVAATLPMAIGAGAIFLALAGIFFGSTPAEGAAGVALLREVLLAAVVAVTVVVVAVPEGLPMMVTVSLALNMLKMAKENCLVRKLVASETIGSATVVCTDKTGTLTENRMVPVAIFAEGRGFASEEFDTLQRSESWNHLVNGLAINSRAELHFDGEEMVGVGNPTESALLKFLHARGVDYQVLRAGASKRYELDHNSDRKCSVVLADIVFADTERTDMDRDNSERGNTERRRVCYRKGAPERILSQCTTIKIGGKLEPIHRYREKIDDALRAMSEGAQRVLALAETVGDALNDCGSQNAPTDDASRCLTCSSATLIGLVGLADPIRSEVPKAVAECRAAQVGVKMVTGDALSTAVAVARQAGILDGTPDERVMTSTEFGLLSDDELTKAVGAIRVLARSTPMDKLRLVEALHRRGDVVAMTGDGTNDAPALKRADVGLAMGRAGTEVAREAADIVLLDDCFASIVTGIRWGRTVFRNIQRFLQFQLSVNAVAILCALIGPLVGVPLPLTVAQLLWINIIMDTFAAMAYSTDPPRPMVLREPPILRTAPILTPTMLWTIGSVSLFQTAVLFSSLMFGWFLDPAHRYDFSIAPTDPNYLAENRQALTVFFTLLIGFQFWHKFNCRALSANESPFAQITKNPLFLLIIGAITVGQIFMVQTPAVGEFFRTEPLSLRQWVEIFAMSATVLPAAWLARQSWRWFSRG